MERKATRHRELLIAGEEAKRVCEKRKGDASAQDECRRVEREVRVRALGVAIWLARQGMTVAEIARKMGMSATTLADWDARWAKDRMPVRRRGRAQEASDHEVKNGVILYIHFVGLHLGLPSLMQAFPNVARAELERLLAQYRHAYQLMATYYVFALRWTRPGTVWAMDFTEAPCDIEGGYPYILIVRDLASGFTLAALPWESPTSEVVVLLLRYLFHWFGAPLVIKTDNGSHFTADEVEWTLAAAGVVQLLSPPYWPPYNGSIEAGGGSLKIRATYAAARNDRPGEWTFDDVEEARESANLLGRPRGLLGPTPTEAWNARAEITLNERVSFLALVAQCEVDLHREHGASSEAQLTKSEKATLRREAIVRAMTARELLLVRRRKVSPPITGVRA